MADRECEPDRREHERRDTAERTLEQHRAGGCAARPLVPTGRLEDAGCVAAERRRQYLAGRVADEVRAHEPCEPFVDVAGYEQPLPAPRHRPDRRRHDREREEPPAHTRLREDVTRGAEIDLPEDVRGAQTRDDEGRPRTLHAASTFFVTKRIRDAARSAAASASVRVSPVARIAPARSEARRNARKT